MPRFVTSGPLAQQGDPIQTAKLVASVDQVSNGRFLPAEDEGELARYHDMGIARVVPMLLSEERDKILAVPGLLGCSDPPHRPLTPRVNRLIIACDGRSDR